MCFYKGNTILSANKGKKNQAFFSLFLLTLVVMPKNKFLKFPVITRQIIFPYTCLNYT